MAALTPLGILPSVKVVGNGRHDALGLDAGGQLLLGGLTIVLAEEHVADKGLLLASDDSPIFARKRRRPQARVVVLVSLCSAFEHAR